MKMAQTRASGTYKIDSLATTKEITAHLNDLGIRTGVEIVVVQKDRKGGIVLHQGTRLALDERVMEQIDVTETQQQTIITSLDQLQVGECGKVNQIAAKGAVRRRLMDMGLTKNVHLEVVKLAPLGDPMEIRLRGYELSLRKQEAALVFVEKGVEA
ncbi:ferrous iron transport protein A [Enterococcus casseliflavus]|uniref:Ferrous iron transport protein A n=1 Tax=Enterococcus casseliflavus TaxID=37734 RepID=A0A415ESV0_ENTCA|nr:ferrous iron transport protein A [Enterococcus casseliflavus]